MSAAQSVPPEKAASSDAPNFRLSWPQQIFGVLGLAISVYAYRAHQAIIAGGSVCGATNSIFNCDAVIGGKYGTFMGVPWGIFGIVFYGIVIVTSIDTDLSPEGVLKSAFFRFIVATIGLFVSVGLTVLSLVIIKHACPICLSAHTMTLLNFCYSAFDYARLRKAAKQ